MNLPAINYEFRKYIQDVEALIMQLPQIECPLRHEFRGGMYYRTIRLPAGMMGTGKIHTHPCRNVLLQGSMTVWAEHTGKVEMKAPFIWDSPTGTKRCFIVGESEDVVWMTIHQGPWESVAEAEAELFNTTYEQYDNRMLGETPCRECLQPQLL